MKRKSLVVMVVALAFSFSAVSCSKLKAMIKSKMHKTESAQNTPAAAETGTALNQLKGTVNGQPVNLNLNSVRAYFNSYADGKKYLAIEASDGNQELTVLLPTPVKEGDTVVLGVIPLIVGERQHLELSTGTALFGPKGADPVLNSTGGFVKISRFEGKVGGKVEGNLNIHAPEGVLDGGFTTVQGSDVVEQN